MDSCNIWQLSTGNAALDFSAGHVYSCSMTGILQLNAEGTIIINH